MISGIVHFKSKACQSQTVSHAQRAGVVECKERVQRTLLSTILKIFWTLIEWLVEQKMSGAFIAFENRFACSAGSVYDG